MRCSNRLGKSRVAVVVVAVLVLAGCTHKFKTDAFEPPAQQLSKSASAYVMLAADGVLGGIKYTGSGQQTSQATMAAVAAHLDRVELASKNESSDEAIATAKGAGIAYVFQPTILHWEDRATEWSGRPDRITIKVVVREAETGKSVASTVARASSKWGTLGGDHPQDLLPELMARFVNRLFGPR